MGPRGLSVLERLIANARTGRPADRTEIHLVDPYEPGAGAVWRVEQSRHLLMNTVACQITVFTDALSRIDGPIEPGPSLFVWAQGLLTAPEPATAAWMIEEATELGPDSYPTRALYGAYLRSCFHRIVRRAPDHVTVREHRTLATALVDVGDGTAGAQAVAVADGSWLTGLDAVVLAQGHVPTRPSAGIQRTLAMAGQYGLRYLPPANPADVDLDAIAPGEPVLLRGLGLCFFDHLTLLTAGRGGVFRRTGDRLVYLPSGREPRLYATSRRGVPYHARGENEKGTAERHLPVLLTPQAVADLRARGPVDFATQLWPLIRLEAEAVYYETLLRRRGDPEPDAMARAYLEAATDAGRAALLDEHGVVPADRLDWERLARPWSGQRFASLPAWQRWLTGYLRADIAHALQGNRSNPLKAALDVLRDIRNEVRLAVDHAGLDGESHLRHLDQWYTPLNAFLSIGPPASRIEELTALIEAGVVVLPGPATRVGIDRGDPAFVLSSELVDGDPVRATTLIEARLPAPDLLNTADPLLRYLLRTGQAAAHRIAVAGGGEVETTGLAVTPRPARLVDASGTVHPRRFAYGVPTESVHWVTAAGIRPCVDSVTLADSDAIARAALALPVLAGDVPDRRIEVLS
ncbi:FAD/NAD(P)-binding protein [Actinoplanes sp. NPDC051494]|uniref:FAD/NAD(P)-binding protein n=1 Tax=Actinoplanes sp. NPDC051494 TaxID=3363907 RepID=UPI00378D7B67